VRRGTTDEWAALVSTALVGTARRPLPPPAGPGDRDPAVTLLERAAMHAVRARAGGRPHTGEPLPAAPPEDRPAVPPAAADRLARIIDGEYGRLLPEWLEHAAAARRRVPARLLPPLLDLGARDRSIRPHLGVVAGRRGHWLATLHPLWTYLAQEPTGDPRAFELGTRGDRRAHLRALRAADPAAARELLAATWETEAPEDREAFIGVLADRLDMADEPFLEAALDDRRREVRQAAADLLTRLSGSRLAARMAERGLRCLSAAERGERLVATPPEACDAAMERDGVRVRPPRGTGERGWWLQQIVARTPLDVWPAHLGAPPERIVAMDGGDWDREVRHGFVRAAVLQRDPAWARALLPLEPVADLLTVLPPGERAAAGARLVRSTPADGQLIMMLGGVPGPWTGALARAVLRKIVETGERQPWNAVELGRLAGERLDPAEHARAESVDRALAETLRFRFEMVKELA
jgi:hypothetical protein